ncbi:MAG: hypothetical protein AAFX94_01335 [Myxococcota bacterium]
MASSTKIKKIRRAMKRIRSGHQRKLELAKKGTTPSKAVFFGDKPETADKAS